MSRLAHVFSVGLVSLCCFLATPDLAAAQDWIEVQSQHFRVVSNQGTRAARQVALQFERIRAVMRTALQGAVADPLRPLVVVAVEGEGDLVALAPEYQNGARPGGFFQSGQYTNHIVLRIETGHATIYHEYFHLLTRLSGLRLPI